MPIYISNNFSKVKNEQFCKAKLVTFLEWQTLDKATIGSAFPVITNEFVGIIQFFQWGLVPVWAKSPIMGNNMAKTKMENLLEKEALQAIYRYKRCVVPVSSYCVWSDAKKTNVLEHSAPTGSIFLLAGLWSVWGEGLNTFSILTQQKTHENNILDVPILLPIHKMPLWLQKNSMQLDFIKKLAV